MPSQRSSSKKPYVTHGSPRHSSESFALSGSDKSSTYYTTSTTYTTTATSNMGRSEYSGKASSRPRETVYRVPDPIAPKRDTITKFSRGSVVINQEKRWEGRDEPRASDARSSEFYNSTSKRPYSTK